MLNWSIQEITIHNVVVEEFHLVIDVTLCGLCGGCVAVCAYDALLLDAEIVREIPSMCTSCGFCIITCPSRALELEDESTV